MKGWNKKTFAKILILVKGLVLLDKAPNTRLFLNYLPAQSSIVFRRQHLN